MMLVIPHPSHVNLTREIVFISKMLPWNIAMGLPVFDKQWEGKDTGKLLVLFLYLCFFASKNFWIMRFFTS